MSAEEMLAGANRAAVIRADGTAEVIHFQDVTATYVLSTLLRGRRDTDVYVALHEPGEMFVMLDGSADIGRRLVPLDGIGKTLHLAAVARGGDAGHTKPKVIELADPARHRRSGGRWVWHTRPRFILPMCSPQAPELRSGMSVSLKLAGRHGHGS